MLNRVPGALTAVAIVTLARVGQVEEAVRTPMLVPGVAGAAQGALGNHFYLVRLENGTVMSWGYNNVGQLGNGHPGPTAGSDSGKTLPFVVQGTAALIPGLTSVTGIAAGSEHAIAVTRDGSVWGWGSNGSGQLALGKSNRGGNPSPVRIPGITRATAVAYGDASYALLEDGTVVGWGDKLWRTGTRAVSSETPIRVPGLTNVSSIEAGLPCIALLRDGSVMTWGSGFLGEGHAAQRDYASTIVAQPAKVTGIEDAIAVASGANTSAVVRRDGSVWIWGSADHVGAGKPASSGQPADQLVPMKMAGLPKAVAVALGSGSSIVFEDGTLRTWGDARLGATGRPGIERIPGPAPVSAVKDLVRVWSRAYGNLGLTRDGHILGWGSVFVAR